MPIELKGPDDIAQQPANEHPEPAGEPTQVAAVDEPRPVETPEPEVSPPFTVAYEDVPLRLPGKPEACDVTSPGVRPCVDRHLPRPATARRAIASKADARRCDELNWSRAAARSTTRRYAAAEPRGMR